MSRMTYKAFVLSMMVAGAGCLNGQPMAPPQAPPTQTTSSDNQPLLGLTPGGTSGGTNNTFNHDLDDPDPFAILQRIQEEGPPEVSTKMHSCQKLKYATLGNVLQDFGVDFTKTGTPPSAAQLYNGGAGAMGGPNYGARVAETIELTAAGATKLFDIFTQAAPEIIAAMPTSARCMGVNMFDAQNHCTLDGITCLTGAPAVQAQADLCNNAVLEASSPAIGQAIAVATILSAAHTCE